MTVRHASTPAGARADLARAGLHVARDSPGGAGLEPCRHDARPGARGGRLADVRAQPAAYLRRPHAPAPLAVPSRLPAHDCPRAPRCLGPGEPPPARFFSDGGLITASAAVVEDTVYFAAG